MPAKTAKARPARPAGKVALNVWVDEDVRYSLHLVAAYDRLDLSGAVKALTAQALRERNLPVPESLTA